MTNGPRSGERHAADTGGMISEEAPEVLGGGVRAVAAGVSPPARDADARTGGLTSGALPVIMPVEYVYEAGVITFRTEHDAKLRAAEHGDVLAFEVDAYDPASGHGWSVHVLGRATVLADDYDARAALRRSTAMHPRVRLAATMCDCTARS